MELSSNIPPQETVAEKHTAIGESSSASIYDYPSDQVPDLSKENPEVKDVTEQSTSLKDYFVCLVHQTEF